MGLPYAKEPLNRATWIAIQASANHHLRHEPRVVETRSFFTRSDRALANVLAINHALEARDL